MAFSPACPKGGFPMSCARHADATAAPMRAPSCDASGFPPRRFPPGDCRALRRASVRRRKLQDCASGACARNRCVRAGKPAFYPAGGETPTSTKCVRNRVQTDCGRRRCGVFPGFVRMGADVIFVPADGSNQRFPVHGGQIIIRTLNVIRYQ